MKVLASGGQVGALTALPATMKNVKIELGGDFGECRVHWCFGPCKSGIYYRVQILHVKFLRTTIPTSNGRISGTKRDFLDPLAPKFLFCRGL